MFTSIFLNYLQDTCLQSIKIDLYDEKWRSTTTDAVGANLKDFKTPTFTFEEKDCKLLGIFV